MLFLRFVVVSFLIVSFVGCEDEIDKAANDVTGKTTVDQGEKMKKQLKAIELQSQGTMNVIE